MSSEPRRSILSTRSKSIYKEALSAVTTYIIHHSPVMLPRGKTTHCLLILNLTIYQARVRYKWIQPILKNLIYTIIYRPPYEFYFFWSKEAKALNLLMINKIKQDTPHYRPLDFRVKKSHFSKLQIHFNWQKKKRMIPNTPILFVTSRLSNLPF